MIRDEKNSKRFKREEQKSGSKKIPGWSKEIVS